MSDPTEYRLEHITDIALIPDEHLDEALTTMRMLAVQLSILRHAMLATGDKCDLRAVCPVIRFTPDGIEKTTAVFPDGQQFVMEAKP